MATKKTVGCDTSIKGLIPGRKPTYVSKEEMKLLKKLTVSEEEPILKQDDFEKIDVYVEDS